MSSANYRDRLFELLPQLYHVWDQGDGSLKAFLEAVGETLDDMERNVSDLYADSFIETCHEWVVPYLGRLIGAKLIESDGNRNRQEVMKTIRWRKRKGTLAALEELAAEVTGWGAKAAEFFEQLGWSQNLNHLKRDHLQTPDLRDHQALFRLGSAANQLLHTVDVRTPCSRQGWFQIKNIGFFLSTAALSTYRKVPMRRVFGQPYRFTLEPKRFPVNLFDGSSSFPLTQTTPPGERFDGFGLGRTVDVYSRGVLAATPEMPLWTGSPAVAPPDPALLDLKDQDGLLPVDWRLVGGEPLEYTITPLVLYESAGKAKLKALGHLELWTDPLHYVRVFDGSNETDGRLVIRVTPQAGYNRSFPAMVLKLVSHRESFEVFAGVGDRQRGIARDRLYCCLPQCSPPSGESGQFVIDRYGSAYHYTHDGSRAKPDDEALFDFTKLARPAEGVVYPSRELSASVLPAPPVYSLARKRALQIVDRGQFLTAAAPPEGWVVKAWNRDNQPGGGVLRLLSAIGIKSLSNRPYRSVIEDHPCEKPGHLILSLHRQDAGWIPEMEVVVTDERGRSLLVYLPQVDDLNRDGAFFYVAEDGASYRVTAEAIPGGLLVRSTPEVGPDGAFNGVHLAKYSAGQVLPIEGQSPIRQRMAVRCDMEEKVVVRPGLLAIDPALGYVAFAKGERPRMPLTAGYHHGLSAYLGAGGYFHNWDTVNEERLIRVAKRSAPDGFRHLRPPAEGIVSKVRVFGTLLEALNEAVARAASTPADTAPLVIQIEDSAIYSETITLDDPLPCGLIVRAAEFERPLWRGRLIWNGSEAVVTPLLAFQGLTFTGTPRIRTGRFKAIRFKDCTLLDNLMILRAVKGEEDRYAGLSLERCLLRGRISIYNHCEISVADSALDPPEDYALAAKHSEVKIERSTVLSKVKVQVLYASESIFMKKVVALNPQKGCVRYCRVREAGDALPHTYKCTHAPVTFCSNLPWRSSYLKLKRICAEPATQWAENGGEIGVYHQANYTLKQKNLMLKFQEYLPVGLTPVLIDVGCEEERKIS